jgi:PBP1b-binding outer membrane lipoprotein LpoB
MTKYILPAVAITAIAFSGCSQVTDTVSSVAKGTANIAKSTTNAVVDTAKGATEKVASSVTSAVDNNKTAVTEKVDSTVSSMKVNAPESTLKVGDVVESTIDDASASASATLPTSTSMTDIAKDKAIEVADEQTNGAATQVIDALK